MLNLASLHFMRPEFLWGVIPLIISMVFFSKQNPLNKNWQHIVEPHLIQSLLVNIGKKSRTIALGTLFLIGLIMLIALAGPSFRKQPHLNFSKQQANIIILDMSSNMNANDIKPSRLSRAKFKIKDLLSNLVDGQVGLVVFSKESFLVSPLTKDQDTLLNLLNELTPHVMPIDGSNISDALKRAATLIKQGGYETGNIVVFTANKAKPKDIDEAKALAQANLHISVIGMATKLGAPVYDAYHQSLQRISRLDQISLSKLASAGHGTYMSFSNTNTDIKQLTDFINTQDAQYKKELNQQTLWQDDGRYLVFLLLPLALLCFRRGFMESM